MLFSNLSRLQRLGCAGGTVRIGLTVVDHRSPVDRIAAVQNTGVGMVLSVLGWNKEPTEKTKE